MGSDNSSIDKLKGEQEQIIKSGNLHWFHWGVIFGSLLLTLVAWYITEAQVTQKSESQFQQEATRTVEQISERMQKYEDALWGGVAAIHSQTHGMDYKEWKRFTHTLKIEKKYPGINGIGIIYSVTSENKDAFLSKARKGRPDFNIHPPHSQKECMPITFIEPIEDNRAAVGLDMAHETNRYNAAKKARKTGQAQITGPITLVQDSEKTPGFLFFAPFYKYGDHVSEEQRHENFLGIVYAPFIFKRLLLGTLDETKRSVGIQVKDGETSLYNELHVGMTDYDPDPMFKQKVEIEMYGRAWVFDIWSSKSFREQTSHMKPIFILIGGVFINALLLFFFILLARANRQAVIFANKMTQNYEEANIELEEFAYRTSHDLRSPIISSIQLLKIAKNYIQNKDYKMTVTSLDHAQTSLKKLDVLIQDILVLTEARNKEEEEQSVNISSLINDTFEKLKHMDGFENLDIQTDLQFDKEIKVKKSRFNMILENFISNAIKYHDPNEEHSYIKISTWAEGKNFTLEIKDNGLGVPEEYQDKLFGMFKRFHPKVSFGSGLGLYLIKKSADILDGEVSFIPHENGSIFRLNIEIQE